MEMIKKHLHGAGDMGNINHTLPTFRDFPPELFSSSIDRFSSRRCTFHFLRLSRALNYFCGYLFPLHQHKRWCTCSRLEIKRAWVLHRHASLMLWEYQCKKSKVCIKVHKKSSDYAICNWKTKLGFYKEDAL
jgi:hypothetical protein